MRGSGRSVQSSDSPAPDAQPHVRLSHTEPDTGAVVSHNDVEFAQGTALGPQDTGDSATSESAVAGDMSQTFVGGTFYAESRRVDNRHEDSPSAHSAVSMEGHDSRAQSDRDASLRHTTSSPPLHRRHSHHYGRRALDRGGSQIRSTQSAPATEPISMSDGADTPVHTADSPPDRICGRRAANADNESRRVLLRLIQRFVSTAQGETTPMGDEEDDEYSRVEEQAVDAEINASEGSNWAKARSGAFWRKVILDTRTERAIKLSVPMFIWYAAAFIEPFNQIGVGM